MMPKRSYMLGDLNADGKIITADAKWILRFQKAGCRTEMQLDLLLIYSMDIMNLLLKLLLSSTMLRLLILLK